MPMHSTLKKAQPGVLRRRSPFSGVDGTDLAAVPQWFLKCGIEPAAAQDYGFMYAPRLETIPMSALNVAPMKGFGQITAASTTKSNQLCGWTRHHREIEFQFLVVLRTSEAEFMDPENLDLGFQRFAR